MIPMPALPPGSGWILAAFVAAWFVDRAIERATGRRP